jgi:RHS repeat-associated protein
VQLNYSYDAFGRRVHKIRRAADGALSNNNFVWDGEVLAAELDDQRGPRAFVHEPGGFEPILQQQGGETFLCVNDHLGMPKDLVSADGLVVWTAAHSAYGRVIAVDADLAAKARYGESASVTRGARGTATGIESPFRLLGQVADEDAELGWTRFRCFDAETGRWLSPDPLGIDGGSNLSALGGAPTLTVDVRGLSTDEKPHRRKQNPGDETYATEEEARKRAFELHGASPDAPYERKDIYGKNDNLKGKKGEPSEQITTITNDDKLKTFDHHKNGHTFEDTNEYELPHYHGPSGEHISYGNPADYEQ